MMARGPAFAACTIERDHRSAAGAALPRLDIRVPLLCGGLALILLLGGAIGAASMVPVTQGIALSGRLILDRDVRAIAHDKGGAIGKVHVIEGQSVTAGQLLVSLETQALDRQIAALKAEARDAARHLERVRQDAIDMADRANRGLVTATNMATLHREVAEVERVMAHLNEQVASAEHDLSRSELRAPAAGQVHLLAAGGAAGMVPPGGTLLAIVPQSSRRVVEGKISPATAATVTPGMPAQVWLGGLGERTRQPLAAKLAAVSPTMTEDYRTGAAHHIARFEFAEVENQITDRTAWPSDQHVDVLLLAGERTLLHLITDPIHKTIQRTHAHLSGRP